MVRRNGSERADARRPLPPRTPGQGRSCHLTRRLHIDLQRICSACGPTA